MQFGFTLLGFSYHEMLRFKCSDTFTTVFQVGTPKLTLRLFQVIIYRFVKDRV